MKRSLLIVLLALLATTFAGVALAGEVRPEPVTWALKAGVIGFTADAAEALDVDGGPYLGVEAFTRIAERLQFGGEVGYARSEGSIPQVTTELTYIPVELNLRYAAAATPLLTFTLGGGVSYSYVRFAADCADVCFAKDDDWLAGVQLFGGARFNHPRYLLGLEGKVQVTEEDLDNWRLAAQAGYRF